MKTDEALGAAQAALEAMLRLNTAERMSVRLVLEQLADEVEQEATTRAYEAMDEERRK